MIRVQAFALLFFISVGAGALTASAQSTSDLQNQITQHNDQIKALQDEITAYQKQLDTLGKQKNTLQSTINALALSQKQLAAQIAITQNNIAFQNQQLEQLGVAIGDKESTIADNQAAIAKALRSAIESEDQPLVARMLTAGTLAEAWQATEEVQQFNRALGKDIDELRTAREELAVNRDEVAAAKDKLVSLQKDLTLQKKSVDASKAAQQQLLADTKNQEGSYQKLIAQKQAAERSFEQELLNLQSQLNLIVHPGSLPKVGTGLLSWPFSLGFMQNCAARKSVIGNVFCITQYFGNTPFATANAQVYNGGGHNGIDIGAPIGTPVEASLTGTVLGTGNTDAVRGCYSFGKWVMIDHHDGLATLYAHLSEIDVSAGESVGTGQVIGLSGMTGYATGPHLHFGVYASEGTKIMVLSGFRGTALSPCANATMPVATKDAYLNPLSYL
jgi:murein DD-endopeptidase MepM/ murein hydrolase activator NlpD